MDDKLKNKKPKLKRIFGDNRIIGLAGEKNSGKTNNLVHLIKDFRKYNKKTPIYVFGLPTSVTDKLIKECRVKEVSTLKQIVHKENCLIIIDEFQKLKLNDKRNKDDLDSFVDLIYHRNVYVILSSPNLREFNSIIGGKIERWLLKTVFEHDCVNGSQLKNIVREYNGRFKSGKAVIVPKNKLLLINDDLEDNTDCPYEEIADSKKQLKSIW